MSNYCYNFMKQKYSRSLHEFLKYFIPLAAVIIIIFFLLVSYETSALRKNIANKEISIVQTEKNMAESNFFVHLSDAVFLAKIVQQRHLERWNKELLRQKLARDFLAFFETRKVYDQIRFLEVSGMEFVRINLTVQGAKIVPKEELQDKSNRYYFTRGIEMTGKVYVSRLDLNMEKGQIEKPFKPMLRMVSPVKGGKNEIIGVVILNYLGNHILDRIRRAEENSQGRLFLINPESYWLIGPESAREWGFMFKGGESAHMKTLFPEEWQQILSQEKGQFFSSKGLFSFHTLNPLNSQFHGFAKENGDRADEYWKLISFVPSAKLVPHWKNTVYGICLILLVITGMIVRLWTQANLKRKKIAAEFTKSRIQAEAELLKVNEALEERVIKRTAEVEAVNKNLQESEKELRQNIEVLERFSRLAVGREEKMIELKKEINELLELSGKEKKYKIIE